MGGEVEPKIWKAAVAAVKRYFDKSPAPRTQLQAAVQDVNKSYYRTGWIMGYRAGRKSARSGGAVDG